MPGSRLPQAGARRRHSRPDHDLDGLRLSVRRRGAGGARASTSPRRVAAGQPDEIAVADTIGVAVPTQVTELIGATARRAAATSRCARTSTTRATPGSPMPTPRCKPACGARCELRWHRRLPVRAGGHRQHSHRRSHLHAASHGRRDRRRSAGTARHQPLAAADARSCRARHAGEGRTVSGQHKPARRTRDQRLGSSRHFCRRLTASGCAARPAARRRSKKRSARTIARRSAEAIKAGRDVNATRLRRATRRCCWRQRRRRAARRRRSSKAARTSRCATTPATRVLHYAAADGMTGICGLLHRSRIAVDDAGRGRRDAAATGRGGRPAGNRQVSGPPRGKPRRKRTTRAHRRSTSSPRSGDTAIRERPRNLPRRRADN